MAKPKMARRVIKKRTKTEVIWIVISIILIASMVLASVATLLQ